MDMLSSRSYLELAQEAEISIDTLSRELTPRRPRRGAQPEMPDQLADKQSGRGPPVRKRGRPKLEAKDATAIEVDPDRPCDKNMSYILTSSTGTPSADPTGTTNLSSQKGEYHPNSQISRQYTREDTRECIRSPRRSPPRRNQPGQ